MESLFIRPQPTPTHSRARRPLNLPSRAPTPEAVNGKHESGGFNGQEYDQSFLPSVMPPERKNGVDGHWEASSSSRRDSRFGPLPTSPPYRSPDAQRPLLPPLKTILGDAMSSPPQTPNLTNASLQQPSPCEPSFSATTYKPLAFYPNKKPRTDFRFQPVAPVTNPTALNDSSGFHDSRRNSNSNEDRAYPSRNGYVKTRHHHSRMRDSSSISYPATSNTRRSSTYRTGYSSHRARPTPPFRQDFAHPDYEYELYHQQRERSIPVSNADDRELDGRDMDGRYSYCLDGRVEGSLQTIYGERPPVPPSDRLDIYAPAGMLHSAHHSSQPPYFVTNHYDYQQGKARKRSNLPKQSTEIMRTWFEQNISNPYPSEEQKAIFSNATGISMTQVSNWFINHRRRCPELRDKRERVRGKENEL